VPSTTPGYRAVLRNTPATLAERLYRTGYPDYLVQVMQTLANGERFAPFTGTVMCQLSASGTVLLRQPCAPDRVFPWPSALLDDSYTAEVWVESDTQPVVPDHYSVTLGTVFLRPELTVAPSEPSAQTSTVSLAITDRRYSEDGAVPAPFSAHGYAVTCSLDDAAFAPCLDGGTMSVLRTPGAHHLTARVGAPDGASKETTVSWQMDTPPTTLALRRPLGYHAAGSSLEVVASGLLPQESYRVLVAGQLVATGHAADDGTVLRVVTIPISTPNGSRPLVVYGATPSRVGRTHIRVVSPVPRTTVSSWWSHRPGAAFLT
ncbi:MAG: hypothetical protein ACJ71T_17330, partial [Actinomycetales bacterium]